MSAKILMVDDDPNLLAACERNLRRQFEVETAPSGAEALAKLAANGPYAVVVADRHMPGMDGIELLAQFREKAPDTMRIMLTGVADVETIIRLVNEDNIFRFLTKPCPTEVLARALRDAQALHQLAVAEKELLNKTLSGSVKLLTDILSMVEARSFSDSQFLRDAIASATERLGLENAWEIQLAAMLAPIGYVTIPPETLVRSRTGQPLSEMEEQMLAHVPETAARLLANIPRLEGVARIVRYQDKCFDGSGFPLDAVAGDSIPLGARLLKILRSLAESQRRGGAQAAAWDQMSRRKDLYDTALLVVLRKALDNPASEPVQAVVLSVEIAVNNLRPGMILRSNVETKEGTLILPAGHQINGMTLEKIRNFHSVIGIKGPILVDNSTPRL